MVIGKVIKMVEVSIQNEIVVLPALIHCCKYLLHVRPKQDTADAHFRRRLPEKFYLEHRFQPQFRLVLPVSYTHLDVYKRQPLGSIMD